MVTRINGNDQVVLQSLGHAAGVQPGVRLAWADSICVRMADGHGPNVAPSVRRVASYAAAPVAAQLGIGAYIGLPLLGADGELIGTLCAFDPMAQPDAVAAEQPLLELLAQLLGSLLQAELEREAVARRNERLQIEAQTDALSGLFNRRAWDRLLATEDERCRRHGHPAAVLMIDLDGLKLTNDTHGHAAGDRLIERTGQVLSQAAREIDIVARVGGDEFGVLGVECDAAGAQALASRVHSALREAGVEASVGMAVREASGDLHEAWQLADQRMYEEKHRRGGRASGIVNS